MMTTEQQDQKWMQAALGMAQSVLYLTSPNPRVGCVIVENEQLVGAGATQRVGGPHAEIVALQQAKHNGADLSQCTVYVTLEPCSHYGKTPPCVDALLQAQPNRVVVALVDPNPLVAGKGIKALRAAGIQVDVGLCATESLTLNPGFVSRMLNQQPFMWLKLAASVDGRSALTNGQSQWITSTAARADGHHWRARSCMVLSGIGTVTDDNPLLNVRGIDTVRQPLRAVVDSTFKISPDAAIFNGDPVWIFTTARKPEKTAQLADLNARVVILGATPQGQVDLRDLLLFLREQAINEIHVEAGATLSGALLTQRCVDQLLLYLAPMLIGSGMPVAQLPALERLADAQRFEFSDMCKIGPDVRLLLQEPSRWEALQQAVKATSLHV